MWTFPLFSETSSTAAITAGTSDCGAEYRECARGFLRIFDGLYSLLFFTFKGFGELKCERREVRELLGWREEGRRAVRARKIRWL